MDGEGGPPDAPVPPEVVIRVRRLEAEESKRSVAGDGLGSAHGVSSLSF
jgi:hypothetical protein